MQVGLLFNAVFLYLFFFFANRKQSQIVNDKDKKCQLPVVTYHEISLQLKAMTIQLLRWTVPDGRTRRSGEREGNQA